MFKFVFYCFLLITSINCNANDFQLIIQDKISGQTHIENHLDKDGVIFILDQLKNESDINVSIKKMIPQLGVQSFRNGGVEGGGG